MSYASTALTATGAVRATSRFPAPIAPLPAPPPPVFPAWLLVTVVFMHVLANAVIAQALPTALLSGLGNDRVRTARLLGRLSSLAALLDIVVTPQLGRLSDTIGRRPWLERFGLRLPAARRGYRVGRRNTATTA